MSVTFTIRGQDHFVNVSNANGRALLTWLGYEDMAMFEQPFGEIPARELAARCRRRLWPEARNEDHGLPEVTVTMPGHPTLHDLGRSPGYLPDRTESLLQLAVRAGDGVIDIG